MDLNSETTGNLMDSDNDGWGWAELLTSPGYTLVLSFPIICLVVPNSASELILEGCRNAVWCFGQPIVQANCSCGENTSRSCNQVNNFLLRLDVI